MQKQAEFQLRMGNPSDLPEINDLLLQESMGEVVDPTECLVVDSTEGLLGFARVEEVEGAGYLRPIVVASKGQGKGIGRTLIENLCKDWPGLRLVARGSAVGFYRKLNFEIIDWNEIANSIQNECESCPDKECCCPTPMMITTSL